MEILKQYKIEKHIDKQKGIPYYHITCPKSTSCECYESIREYLTKEDIQEHWSEDFKFVLNKCLQEVSYVNVTLWIALY